MFLCSSRFVMRKRHKIDMGLVLLSLLLLFFGQFYAQIYTGDKRLMQMACALPTLRLLTFLAVPKKFLRATWLGFRAASSLVPPGVFRTSGCCSTDARLLWLWNRRRRS